MTFNTNISLSEILNGLMILGAMLVFYFKKDSDVTNRITAVESEQKSFSEKQQQIRSDCDSCRTRVFEEIKAVERRNEQESEAMRERLDSLEQGIKDDIKDLRNLIIGILKTPK